jgi:hypothetical protein
MQKYLSRINFRQIIAIGGFVLLAYLMLDLNARVTEYLRVSKERDRLGTVVAKFELTRQVLQTDVAYATSAAAVGDWARGEGYLVKPGDVRIVPLVPGDATPTPPAAAVATPRVVEYQEVWYALFFGE